VSATVFLGGGRITAALISGLRLAKYRDPIIVHDRHANRMRALQRQYGIVPEPDLTRAVEKAQLLVIAVRPDSISNLLRQIGNVSRSFTAVSLAAGVPLRNVRVSLGPTVQWARAMPSPVCRSGRGLTALTFDRTMRPAARQRVREFFASVGSVIEVPEPRFDAFTVTYSSSHGYHALKALAEAGQKLGLDRKTALAAAAHALADGIGAWRESNASLDRLLQEATTPGGIAAAVMSAMDAAGYRRSIQCGLKAGMKRARTNAKR
jgi:pyrroline-5-carboxylate reductase